MSDSKNNQNQNDKIDFTVLLNHVQNGSLEDPINEQELSNYLVICRIVRENEDPKQKEYTIEETELIERFISSIVTRNKLEDYQRKLAEDYNKKPADIIEEIVGKSSNNRKALISVVNQLRTDLATFQKALDHCELEVKGLYTEDEIEIIALALADIHHDDIAPTLNLTTDSVIEQMAQDNAQYVTQQIQEMFQEKNQQLIQGASTAYMKHLKRTIEDPTFRQAIAQHAAISAATLHKTLPQHEQFIEIDSQLCSPLNGVSNSSSDDNPEENKTEELTNAI